MRAWHLRPRDLPRPDRIGDRGESHRPPAPHRQGLPSLAGPDGTFAYGPSDVSVKNGLVFVSIGGPNEVGHRELLTEAIAKKLGTVQLLFGRHSITVGDISEFVAGNDPDGPPDETNTHSVLAGWHGLYAIDAASNALFGINWRGRLEGTSRLRRHRAA